MSEMNLENIKSAHIGRRAVLCGAVALALGVTTDIASASSPAVGVKQVGKKLQIELATVSYTHLTLPTIYSV